MKQAAVIILKNNKGEVLLLNRKSPPFGYGLPGGKIEKNESIKDGCLRELKEETGITLKKDEVYFKDFTSSDDEVFMIYIFSSDVIIDQSSVKITSEHSDYIFTKDFNSIKLAGKTLKFIKL